MDRSYTAVMVILVIVIAIAVVVLALVIGAYNGLIRRRNQIENAWSQIDVHADWCARETVRTW